MKPIWYFVGLLLLALGILVFITGIYFLISPPLHQTILGETHPSIWWGAIMIVAGGIFLIKNWNVKVE
jgi:drug/metabolite transporter (DMT)-like permease